MESAAVSSAKKSGLHQSQTTEAVARFDAWAERSFFAFLIAVFGYLAYFSSQKLLWFDELLSYYTEHAPTTSAVLRIQATTPVSLDPPLYHLLGHWILTLGFNPAFSIRFLSLLGCIAMTAGVYLYTRRIAGFYAAAISVAGLILTYDFYLVEARPYGILLGATGLSLLFWQNAIRNISRRLSLIGLFLVLAFAISCHYFGILVPVPILLAEFFRTIRRRKLDLVLLAATLSSYACALFWLPFLKAASQYKAHYYVSADFMSCIRSYSWLDEIHRSIKGLSAATDTLLFLLILATVVAGAYLSFKASQKTATSSHESIIQSLPEEWAAFVFVALIPVFGGLLALAGAGSYLARYVLESSIGLMVPRVSAILAFIQSRAIKTAVLTLCAALIVAACIRDKRHDAKENDLLRFSLSQADPQTLVIPDQYDEYLQLHYYESPQTLEASQFPFIADMARELEWKGTDNLSRTMINMKQFTTLPVMSYDDLLHTHKQILLIVDKTNRHTWIAEQLKKDHVQLNLKATRGNLSAYNLQLPASALP
jgi:4-amino-4-deoxy-L-arabinose transferase-like glycosyltransferase